MDIDKLLDSLNADEKGRIFSKLKAITKEYQSQQRTISDLEFNSMNWLILRGLNDAALEERFGGIEISSFKGIELNNYLDGFNYDNVLNIKLEESFKVHQFLRIVYYFKNRGYEFSNTLGMGFHFRKIYDQD